MARKRKCKWLKTFRLSWKCRKCRHRRRCEKVIRSRKITVRLIFLILTVLLVFGIWKVITTKENNIIEDEKIEFVKIEYSTKSEYNANVVSSSIPVVTPDETDKPTFTKAEIEALGKVIFKEAAGEPYIGKVAVGAVAMNRLKTGKREFNAQNGDLMDVILYKGAFASIEGFSNEEFEETLEYEECMKAANASVNGEDPTRLYFKDGAVFFYAITEELSEKEAKKREDIDTFLIGNHAFHIELH